MPTIGEGIAFAAIVWKSVVNSQFAEVAHVCNIVVSSQFAEIPAHVFNKYINLFTG